MSSSHAFNALDWDAFFIALRKYLEYFRSIPAMPGFPSISNSQRIADEELHGLLAFTKLATAAANTGPEVRRHMNEDRTWNCVENTVGLLSCAIPLILKGKLYEFLAAMAVDENIAIHIWNCLIAEGMCIEMNGGNLCGIQQDLEEQESVAKAYDCSEGFLRLMKELFRHKTRPGTAQLAPYLHFITRSIICQFASRSYVDLQQMWDLARLALDCLCELLRMFYVTQAVVSAQTSEVWLLTQLLNNTPLLVNVLQIIVEGRSAPTQEASARIANRDEASLAAIRLIYMAVGHRSALLDAIRAVASNLMICTLEALMFSPLPNLGKQHHAADNCLSLLFSYFSEDAYFIKHTFYVVRILRDLCCQQPSLQRQILQSAAASQMPLIDWAASLTGGVFDGTVEVLHADSALSDVDGQSAERIRGEIIRNFFELFIDSIRSDPKSFNFAYFLLGFDSTNINNTDINFVDNKEVPSTCLYNFIEIIHTLATREDYLHCQYTGLYEPCIRLLLKLASFSSISSSVSLRIMRSHYDLVYKLVISAVFRPLETVRLDLSTDFDTAAVILRKSIQCAVLELVALEFAALLRLGQSIEQPKKMLSALLAEPSRSTTMANGENSDDCLALPDDTFASTLTAEQTPNKALLWLLLEQSRFDVDECKVSTGAKFDSQRIDELLQHCVRKNSCNIEQFDIEYLHLLLNTEINSIMNAEIEVIKREARNILEFCAEHNAKNLLESACIHLLSGWLSVINVLAIYSPLVFIDENVNKEILVDALFLLKNYCFCVDTNDEITSLLSSCIFRVVRAICGFYTAPDAQSSARQTLFPIIHLLLQCLALPRYSKCVRFKLDIYGSILCVFDTCNRSVNTLSSDVKSRSIDNKTAVKSEATTLTSLMESEHKVTECWSKHFEPMTAEIVDTISSDITYAPLSLKIAATSCLSDIIREDIVHSKSVAYHFVYSGAMACVLDALMRVVTEFRHGKHAKSNAEKSRKQLLLVKTLFSLFMRLAASEYGWTAMINGRVFKRLLIDEEKENESVEERPAKEETIRIFKKLLETMSKF